MRKKKNPWNHLLTCSENYDINFYSCCKYYTMMIALATLTSFMFISSGLAVWQFYFIHLLSYGNVRAPFEKNLWFGSFPTCKGQSCRKILMKSKEISLVATQQGLAFQYYTKVQGKAEVIWQTKLPLKGRERIELAPSFTVVWEPV